MRKLIAFKFFSVFICTFLLFGGECSAQMYSVKDSVNDKGQQCKIFTYTAKAKGQKNKNISYVFIENRSDISLGCEVYRLDNGEKTFMDYFAVASYTKDESGRMNYNSILPYISICQAGKRTILSFECPLIVINPDKLSEKIVETKNLYGKVTENAIEITNY
ncbi:MAG: hypothetical protein IJ759_00745 [Bacteroidales bacterium]|nr:hypothetical protein [Bacteroidales bacterium]